MTDSNKSIADCYDGSSPIEASARSWIMRDNQNFGALSSNIVRISDLSKCR